MRFADESPDDLCVAGLTWLPLGELTSFACDDGVIASADNCRMQFGFLDNFRIFKNEIK